MEKSNKYIRPSVKVRVMESVMIGMHSGDGGAQLVDCQMHDDGFQTEDNSVENNDLDRLPKQHNLWEE